MTNESRKYSKKKKIFLDNSYINLNLTLNFLEQKKEKKNL